jgi:hypothetical protein
MDNAVMDSGVKVVGGVPDDHPGKDDLDDRDEPTSEVGARTEDESAPEGPPPPSARRRPGGAPSGPSRRRFRVVSVVAALGLLGTLIFGFLYATSSRGGGQVQDPAVLGASRTFLTDFFNFDAKSVDTDFNAITGMATGQFSSQAQQFFNSSIRKALEQALAESRGQVRYLEVQQENDPPGTASVYAVIDQTYVNDKISTPQSDVVRLIADLQQVDGVWKISNVTVLEGATPASTGSASGSAGSNVPGQ